MLLFEVLEVDQALLHMLLTVKVGFNLTVVLLNSL